MHQVCALYYADFLCGGYALPRACEGSGNSSGPGTEPAWLRLALVRLLDVS